MLFLEAKRCTGTDNGIGKKGSELNQHHLYLTLQVS